MTQEQKARRYDEALKVAKGIYAKDAPDSLHLEKMFPELNESEDEKIRKSLIILLQHFCKGYRVPGLDFPVSYKNMLAWLEKQGEHSKFLSKIQVGDKVTCNEDGILVNLSQLNRVAKKDEKQGEQKPNPCDGCINRKGCINCEDGELRETEQKTDDWATPKFKDGDWVVDENGIVKKILSYNNGVYKHTDGYSAKIFEDEWRLWDITKDAKDGDVLAFDNNTIVIFKDLYNASSFHSYCHIEDGVFDINENETLNWWEGEGFKPAAKEQRDLLFQKMKEAGYEWNAEKKELKKIEQKSATIDIDKMVNDYANNKERGNEEFGKPVNCMIRAYRQGLNDAIGKVVLNPAWSEENEQYIKELESLVKQVWATAEHKNDKDAIHKMSDLSFFLKTLKPQLKQDWSEEDESYLNTTIVYLKDAKRFKKTAENCIDWLKSIKERVQPKREWSEEDNEHVNSLLKRLEGLCRKEFTTTRFAINEDEDWLKSLKPPEIINKNGYSNS